MKSNKEIYNLTLAAIFLSLTFVLPFLTGQIPEIGSMLCPMHIPVLLCGFICGWKYGLVVGLIAPVLRSIVLGMPPLFPTGLCMSLELASYGVISGIAFRILPKKTFYIYVSLIIAMMFGRIVWGTSMFFCYGLNFSKFGLINFWTGAFVNALPGIIVQIVLIPIIIIVYKRLTKRS